MILFEWQIPIKDSAVASLKRHRVFACAACTGAGKTPISCQVIAELKRPAVVVCPKVSITQWNRWIDRTPGCRDHVLLVTNPERITRSAKFPYYDKVRHWHDLPDDTIVVWDEIHKGCSGAESALTEAAAWVKRIPQSSLLALSATMADSPLKMRCIGFWMGFWKHFTVMSEFKDWCRKNGCSTRQIFVGGRSQWIFDFTKSKVLGPKYMAEIHKAMGERFLAVNPDDIPGFPDEVMEVLRIDLEKDDRLDLEREFERLPENLKHLSENELVVLGQLQQRAELFKAKPLAQLAADRVEEGLSVVVLVNYRETVSRIAEELDALKVGHVEIVGQMNHDQRQRNIDRFQANEVFVCLATLKAAGVSLSLHDERHERRRVSYISPGYDSSDVKQALGRIRRVGGTTAVQHFVLAAGTVEEKVADAIERKLACIDSLNDGDLAL